MRAASLNVVNDKGVDCLFGEVFGEFSREVSAETRLLSWVQSSLLSWVYSWGGDRVGVLSEIRSAFCKVGEGECKALVFCWGNGDGSIFPVNNRVYYF